MVDAGRRFDSPRRVYRMCMRRMPASSRILSHHHNIIATLRSPSPEQLAARLNNSYHILRSKPLNSSHKPPKMANRTRIVLSAASKVKKFNKGIQAAAATSSANTTEELTVCEADPPPFSYIPLHHHRDRSLFRPITPGTFRYLSYHYLSSLKGLASLLTSQEARDRFVKWTGGNESTDNDDQDNLYSNRIVNANVLGQSDMGFLKPMTLFHELNSPLYNEYGIEDKVDIKDFLDGCGFAIEQYMRAINDNLRGENFRKWTNKVLEDAREMSKNETDTPDDIEKLMAVMSKPPDSVDKYDFTEVGRKDPNSIEAFLMDMTTPIGWDNHNFNARMKLRLEISEDNLPKFAKAQDLASHHSGEKLNAKVLHVSNNYFTFLVISIFFIDGLILKN